MAMLVPAIALLVLSACGGGGGGGGVAVEPLPTAVFVDDAPIIGARVQDGAVLEALPSAAPGGYRFESAPTLPLKISSRNIVGADGRVAVTQADGAWYSYADTNNNGRWDSSEPREPLTFQDLDGNGLYTQSVDIVFNGSFLVNYAKPGATVIQANVVASLLPRTWNGTTPVAGVSAAALNAAVSVGPTQSANAELQRATAVLTAISEGLVSTLRTSTTNTTAQTQTTINNALSAIANSSVNLAATDATSIGQVAATVSGSVPQAVTQANNLVSNVMSIASGTTTNFEAVVKVTQEKLSEVVSAPQQAQQDKLKDDVQLAASAIGAAQSQAVPNRDPDGERIAELRLIPLGIPDVSASTVEESWISLASTSGFSLERQPDGSMQFRASGVPFQDVLGATSKNIPFVSSRNSWEYTGPLNEKLKIKVNISVPKALFNPNLGPDAGAFSDSSSMQLCTSAGACIYYFLFSPAQLCNPDWQAMVNLGTADAGAKNRFYTALNTINVGPNRPAVTCN